MAGPAGTRQMAATVLAAVALVCVTALATGCTSAPMRPPAHRAPPSHSASAGPVTDAQRQALAARYLVIAKAGNHRLEVEFGHLHGRDRGNLAAAHRDLREVAATERTFDQQLLGIAFPAATERIVRFLYWVNQSRASLTATAATAPSLHRLRVYERRMNQANKPVEQAVAIIRSQLGLPPAETS